jgi:hypothetical protein
VIKISKYLIALLSVVVIVAAWAMYTTISPRLDAEQKQLVEEADEYLSRKIYDIGADILNRALQIETDRNAGIWRKLADTYYEWGEYSRYRDTVRVMIYGEILPEGKSLADLYLELYMHEKTDRPVNETLNLLKEGIKKTGSEELRKIYDSDRFQTVPGRHTYDDAYSIFNGAGLVRVGDLWGYTTSSGRLNLRPEFELATNFAVSGREVYAAVYKEGELYIINRNGYRRALADDYINTAIEDIQRFTGRYFTAKLPGENDFGIFEWTNTFAKPVITLINVKYEDHGLTEDGIMAIKNNGFWHIIDVSGRTEKIAGDRSFEDVALDEFGRCAASGAGAIFAKTDGKYYMIGYDGKTIAGPFDDAKPFFEKGGWAAVKNNGKWGFIYASGNLVEFKNASGNLLETYIFEDAGSSSSVKSSIADEILAPVKQDGLWGYIKTDGGFAIEPRYDEAKQFVNGCAAVAEAVPVSAKEAEAGIEPGMFWYYIVLAEYAS